MTAEATTQTRTSGSSARAATRSRTPLGLSFFAFVLIDATVEARLQQSVAGLTLTLFGLWLALRHVAQTP